MGSRIAFGIANPRDRAASFCVGNLVEHALRRRSNIAWIGRAGGHHFLCRFSPMAAARGHGILSSPILFGRTHSRTDTFRATQHDQRWLLRDSRRTRRRFRNSYHWTLPPGARRWRTASASHRHFSGKTRPRDFFWRAYHSSRISCAGAKRRDERSEERRV